MPEVPTLVNNLRVVEYRPGAIRAHCPLHNDRSGVLELTPTQRDWRWRCPSCGAGNSLHLAWLLWRYCDVPRRFLTDLTLDRLAREKNLPVDFLREVGLFDLQGRLGIGIPYRDRSGRVLLVKRRWRVKASRGSSWPARTCIRAYGEERLARAEADGRLILVNGESDAWTVWYHSLPALALPGYLGVQALTNAHLEAIHHIFLFAHRRDFNSFSGLVRYRLKEELHWPGTLVVLKSPVGNDLNALHRRAPSRFRTRIERMLGTAAAE